MDENQDLGGRNEIESIAIFNPKQLAKSNEQLSYQEALNASGVGHGPLPTSWKASSKNKVGILCL